MSRTIQLLAAQCLAAMIAVLAATSAHATTISIGASRDTTLYRVQPDRGNAQGIAMFAGQEQNGSSTSKRALIGFDIASNVPAGSTITSVQLALTFLAAAGSNGVAGAGDATPRQLDLYAMTSDWAEGTSGTGNTVFTGSGQGFTASAGEATWNNRVHPSTPWSTVGGGGDFAGSASASLVVGNPNSNAVFTWGSTSSMVANVQSWLDLPLQNDGWILKANNENVSQSSRAFFTSEAANANFRPALTIIYVPEPATWVLLALSGMGLAMARRRLRSRD